MHEVLVNRLGGLSLPRKSVVRLTDRPDMTLDVYCGRKTTMQQQQQHQFMRLRILFAYLTRDVLYSRLSLSRSRRDPLKHFEISVLRHIRFAELRKIPIERSNFTNEHVI